MRPWVYRTIEETNIVSFLRYETLTAIFADIPVLDPKDYEFMNMLCKSWHRESYS